VAGKLLLCALQAVATDNVVTQIDAYETW